MKTQRASVTIGDKTYDLSYDMRAHYMMGTLDRPFALEDIANPKRATAALLAWVWACLPDEAYATAGGHAGATDPKTLAKLVPLARVPELLEAFSVAVRTSAPSEKNAGGSTSQPSSRLSSESTENASAA
jgi:hypothetical protein